MNGEKVTVVPKYRNKGDIQSCTNYLRIKHISHIMKLWDRVIEQGHRQKTRISEKQFDSMPRDQLSSHLDN